MAQELETLLLSLTKADNAVLKQNTAKLQKFMKGNSDAGGLMLQQLAQSKQTEVRQMAGILLRQEMDGDLWKKLNDQQKGQWAGLLLERLVNEEVDAVRQAVAMLVKSICKRRDEWPELLKVLEQMITGNNPSHRKTAVKLMRSAIGTRACLQYWRHFFKIFCQVLSGDADLDTLVEAIKGIAAGAAFLECDDESPELAMLPKACPRMVEVLKSTVEKGDSMAMGNVIEVFNDLILIQVDAFGGKVVDVAKFMLQIATMEGEVEPEMRAKALAFIGLLAQRKMKLIQSHKLVDPIFEVSVKAIMEPLDGDDDDDESAMHGTAADVLDAIFCGVPRYIFKRTLDIVGKLGSENDVSKRYAGILMLMLMLEGCQSMIKADPAILKHIVEYNIKELNHPEPRVRAVACQCVVQVATHLEPEALQFSKPILQALVQMNQASFVKPNQERVAIMAWSAMDCWIQEMGEGAKDVLADLMTLLSNTMQGQLSDSVKDHVLQVLGTLASAVGKEFAKYYRPVVNMLAQFVGQKAIKGRENDQEWIELVGAAWTTLGNVMNSVGVEGNEQDIVMNVTTEILQAMTLKHAPMAAGFNFLTAIVALFKDKTKNLSFYRPILQIMGQALMEDDGVEIIDDDEGFGPNPSAFGFEENKQTISFDEPEALANIGPNCKMQIKQAVLEKCIAALQLAHALCKNVPLGKEELEGVYQHSMLFFDYPHPTVRLAVIEVLAMVVHNVADQYPSQKWKDQPPGTKNEIHPEVLKYVTEIPLFLLTTAQEDDDQDNVSIVLEHVNNIILKLGPGVLMVKIEDTVLMELLLKTLHECCEENLPCQQDVEEGEVDETQELEETHKIVVDSALGILGSLARLYGSQFEPEFQKFYPKLMKFAHKKRHNNFRAIAIGCLGDVMEWLAKDEKRTGGTALQQYLAPSVKEALTMAVLEDEESLQMRQNSIFCLGCLFQAGREGAFPFCTPFIKACASALALPRGHSNKLYGYVRDNTVSALCKMTQELGSKLDEGTLREVGAKIVDCLPLEKDFVENKYVYPTLCLFLKGGLLTGQHLTKAQQLLQAVAKGESTGDQIDEKTAAYVKNFVASN